MRVDVPVLVIYRGGYGAVSIARTLGRLGVPVYLLAQVGMPTPVSASRYWIKKYQWDFGKTEAESVDHLLGLGREIEEAHGTRPVLLTLADWIAIFIDRNGDALEERFVLPRADRPVIHDLVNKWEMHLLAAKHGIPVPATKLPRSRDDVEEWLDTASFPVVLKSADPFLPHTPAMRIIGSREELLDTVDREAAHGPLNFVLQEYIPGGPDTVWMCNAYVAGSPDRTVVFSGKKLRQVSSTGIASLAICLPNETVESQTRSFMHAVGYRGCVGIGYRYDNRDGLYKLLDVNARVSGVFRLFTARNDIDPVRACYLDLTGQDIGPAPQRPGRKWMLEDDLPAALSAIRRGDLTPSEWLRSIRGVKELHWLAPDDPVPFLSWVSARIKNSLSPRVGRLLQRSAGR